MPFNPNRFREVLSSGTALLEEKPKFNPLKLKVVKPPETTPKFTGKTIQSIATNPIVSKALDVATKIMPMQDWQKLQQEQLDIGKTAIDLPGAVSNIMTFRGQPKDVSTLGKAVTQPFEPLARIYEPTIRAPLRATAQNIRALISPETTKPVGPGQLLQESAKAFFHPESVNPISRTALPLGEMPFVGKKELTGGVGALIPRSILEAIESVLVYSPTIKTPEIKTLREGINELITKKSKVNYKQSLEDAKNVITQYKEPGSIATKAETLSNEGSIIPLKPGEATQIESKVRDLWSKQIYQSRLSKTPVKLLTPEELFGARPKGQLLLPKLASKKGSAIIPFNEGDIVNFGKESGKILKLGAQKALLSIGGKEVEANLNQLSPTLAPKSPVFGDLAQPESIIPGKAGIVTPPVFTGKALGQPTEGKVEQYGMSHRPTYEGMPPAYNLLEGETLPRDVYINPDFSISGGRIRSGDKSANESWKALQEIKGKPDTEITIYRASPKNELNSGDWVTFSKEYAKLSAEKDEKVFSYKVKAKDIIFAGDDINEFGYYPKSTPTGEGQKPPVEPPKTAVGGEPAPVDYNKLFKNYVQATPIGKVISSSQAAKVAIANEDFLIKAYERDIGKLEEQLKIEQFNTEAEKIKAQDKLQALKNNYTLAKETQRQKKAYRDEVAGLVKFITAEPKENLAIEYQDMIEQLQSKFDLKRRTEATEAKRESMKAFVERMKVEGKAINIPENKLAMLEKVTLNEMTLDQLRVIKKTIDDLLILGKTKLKAREAVYASIKEKAKIELLSSITPINSKELAKLPIGENHPYWIQKAIRLQNAAQKTGVGLTPIDGLADITGMSKMKKVLDKDFSKYLAYNDKAIEDWYNLTKNFTEKEFERIGVVAASRQEGGLERLSNSGINEKEVNAVKLTPAEEKAYQFVLDTFDKEYPAVKQYAKEIYNADVGQQENYVSFMSDYEQMSDLEIYERFGQTPEQIANRKTKTVEQGFTKERSGISKIKLEINIDKIFRRHMDDVAYMLNTGKNIKMYFEIVNSPEMREKLGDVGVLAWLQWLDLMARKGGSEGAKRIAVLDILRKNIGAGVLSFRLSSALVQFSSFADTIATIGAEWATKGATAISDKTWRNFIMDNFPEVRKAVGDDIAFREFGENALGKLARVGLKPLQFLDGLMRSTAAAGAYQKLATEKGIVIDLNTPDAELVAEATKLMRNSQGSSFFKDQPLAITAGYGLTDNKSVNKLLLTFQSFMLNRWDNINRQIYRLGIKEKNYGKAISSVFWLLIFAVALEEGIRRGSRKITQVFAKDKRDENSYIQNTLLNMVQSIPLVGQLVSAITYSSNPVPVINTFDDLLEGISTTVKGKAVETKIKGAVKAIGATGSLLGIAGASQTAQIVRGMIPTSNSFSGQSFKPKKFPSKFKSKFQSKFKSKF